MEFLTPSRLRKRKAANELNSRESWTIRGTRHRVERECTYYDHAIRWRHDWNVTLKGYNEELPSQEKERWRLAKGKVKSKDVITFLEFKELAIKWKRETGHFSTMFHKANNINYLKIIGMGEKALPFILKDLQEAPEHWFVALNAITKQNPIPPDDMDDMHKMSQSWIKWGIENNWI